MMKTIRQIALITTLVLASNVYAQTISGYGVTKTAEYNQTSAGAPSATGSYFNIFLFGTDLAGSYTFSAPAGSSTFGDNPQTINTTSSGGNFSANFADQSALDAAYGNGVYSFSLPNINGGSQSPNPDLTLSGDNYAVVPMVTGGTWSNGKLLVDPTQNYNLSFTEFTNRDVNSSFSFNIEDGSENSVVSLFPSTDTVSYLINAGTLVSGQTYTVTLRFNNSVIDYGNLITSANGGAGFSSETYFTIQAVPEPSTYGVILGTVVLIGVFSMRRRKLV